MLPLAQLPRKAHFHAALAAGRGTHQHFGAVPEPQVVAAQGLPQRFVFQETNFRQAARPAVGAGGEGQTGAKVLVVARPGVGGRRVEQVFEAGAEHAVGRVAHFEAAHRALGPAGGPGEDAPPHGVGPGQDFSLNGGQPGAGHRGVGVDAGDDAGRAADLLQAGAGGVHQQAAGPAHVGFGRRQAQLGRVQRQVRKAAGLLAHHVGGAVGAVIGQYDDFEAVGRQRLAAQAGLGGQGSQRGGQVGHLVFGRDDDAGQQAGVRGRQLPVQLPGAAALGRRGQQAKERKGGSGSGLVGGKKASGSSVVHRQGVRRPPRKDKVQLKISGQEAGLALLV